MAITLVSAVESVSSLQTFAFAVRSLKSRRAGTGSVDRVTGAAVLAITGLRTVLSIHRSVAGTLTLDTLST